jgi:hypothetical protein
MMVPSARYALHTHRPFVFSRPPATPTATSERELSLSNAVSELVTGDRDRNIRKRLEPCHRCLSPSDRAVVLLDEIIEILVCAHPAISQGNVSLGPAQCALLVLRPASWPIGGIIVSRPPQKCAKLVAVETHCSSRPYLVRRHCRAVHGASRSKWSE